MRITDAPDQQGSFQEGAHLERAFKVPAAAEAFPRDGPPASDLARIIETEVIPRMLIAHQAASHDAMARLAAIRDRTPPGFDVDLLVALALEDDDALRRHVMSLLDAGVDVEAVYLDLLAPAARRLGDLWNRDFVSFLNVTLALGRLQRTLHAVQTRAPASRVDGRKPGGRALVAAAPGEQHTFGASMVADIFRRAGWRVSSDADAPDGDMLRLVREELFDVAAVSASGEAAVSRLPALFRAIRRNSKNTRIMIMVGGRPFAEQPELAARLGADATAADAVSAVATAERLLDLAARVD